MEEDYVLEELFERPVYAPGGALGDVLSRRQDAQAAAPPAPEEPIASQALPPLLRAQSLALHVELAQDPNDPSIWHGPTAPGPGWVDAGTGPRGGKMWKYQGQGALPQGQAPQQQPVRQPQAQSAPVPPSPDDTPLHSWAKGGLNQVLANPRPNTPEGMASIAEVRRQLQARGGMRERFNETLMDLFRKGEVRLIGAILPDNLVPGDREDGVPGVNETFVWAQPMQRTEAAPAPQPPSPTEPIPPAAVPPLLEQGQAPAPAGKYPRATSRVATYLRRTAVDGEASAAELLEVLKDAGVPEAARPEVLAGLVASGQVIEARDAQGDPAYRLGKAPRKKAGMSLEGDGNAPGGRRRATLLAAGSSRAGSAASGRSRRRPTKARKWVR